LAYAQTLYLLPVSLFGMSISAAELPSMSSAKGTPEEVAAFLRDRIRNAQQKIAFFVIPSAVAFFALGNVIISLIFQGGAFTRENTHYVWSVLAGSAIGLLSATWGRIYSSSFYAMKDTRTPFKFALIRVALTTVLGLIAALYLPSLFGLDPSWGTAGLTASAGLSGWVEFLLLRRASFKKIGEIHLPQGLLLKLWSSAIVSATLALLAEFASTRLMPAFPRLPHLITAMLEAGIVLGTFGVSYFAIGSLLGVGEAQRIFKRLGLLK
jgi:putative peptidoglycan lipid II flippase